MVESVLVDRLLPPRNVKSHTAAYKVFHYQFLCRIAHMHLYSAEYLQQAGMLTTGNAGMDRSAATEMVDVRLTIAAIAEYMHEGATVLVNNPEDCVKIYRIIKEHLDDWLAEVQQSMHRFTSPTDDLRKLDVVAGAVYPYAKVYMQEKPFHGRLTDTLANIFRSRGGIGRQTADQQQTQKQEQRSNTPLAHTPMADAIANHTLTRRKAWDSKTPR